MDIVEMNQQRIFLTYAISNLCLLLFVFVYGIYDNIWPLQFYFGIFVFFATLVFGKILTR